MKKEDLKLVKKSKQSTARKVKIESVGEKLLKSKYEYDNKDKRKLHMNAKKVNEDEKREYRRDERYMSKKK